MHVKKKPTKNPKKREAHHLQHCVQLNKLLCLCNLQILALHSCGIWFLNLITPFGIILNFEGIVFWSAHCADGIWLVFFFLVKMETG